MDLIIREINKKYAKFLVFGTSADTPLFFLQEIGDQTRLSKGDAVLFDQLLQTGDADNRFLIIKFGDNDFDLSTISHLDREKIDLETKEIVASFLRSNPLVLRYSILPEQQKETILDGGII